MADEIEMKLTVAPERAGEVRRLELLRQLAEKRGSTRQLSTVYFDTPDQALAKRGIALRIRSAGRRKLQTIKLPGRGARRPPDAARGGDAGIAATGRNSTRSPICACAASSPMAGSPTAWHPSSLTEFKRTAWPLRFNGSLIELAFDQGEIRAGVRPACRSRRSSWS